MKNYIAVFLLSLVLMFSPSIVNANDGESQGFNFEVFTNNGEFFGVTEVTLPRSTFEVILFPLYNHSFFSHDILNWDVDGLTDYDFYEDWFDAFILYLDDSYANLRTIVVTMTSATTPNVYATIYITIDPEMEDPRNTPASVSVRSHNLTEPIVMHPREMQNHNSLLFSATIHSQVNTPIRSLDHEIEWSVTGLGDNDYFEVDTVFTWAGEYYLDLFLDPLDPTFREIVVTATLSAYPNFYDSIGIIIDPSIAIISVGYGSDDIFIDEHTPYFELPIAAHNIDDGIYRMSISRLPNGVSIESFHYERRDNWVFVTTGYVELVDGYGSINLLFDDRFGTGTGLNNPIILSIYADELTLTDSFRVRLIPTVTYMVIDPHEVTIPVGASQLFWADTFDRNGIFISIFQSDSIDWEVYGLLDGESYTAQHDMLTINTNASHTDSRNIYITASLASNPNITASATLFVDAEFTVVPTRIMFDVLNNYVPYGSTSIIFAEMIYDFWGFTPPFSNNLSVEITGGEAYGDFIERFSNELFILHTGESTEVRELSITASYEGLPGLTVSEAITVGNISPSELEVSFVDGYMYLSFSDDDETTAMFIVLAGLPMGFEFLDSPYIHDIDTDAPAGHLLVELDIPLSSVRLPFYLPDDIYGHPIVVLTFNLDFFDYMGYIHSRIVTIGRE